jgi:hypothetical protein
MTSLPHFNQSSFAIESFYEDTSGPVWPKYLTPNNSRILLPISFCLTVTVDAASIAQRITAGYNVGGAPSWVFTFDPILPVGGPYEVCFHPGPSSMLTLPPYYQFDFTIPDWLFQFSNGGSYFQLNTMNAGDDITFIAMSAKSWIL